MTHTDIGPEVLERAGLRLETAGLVATITLDRPSTKNSQTPATWLALRAIGAHLPAGTRVTRVEARTGTIEQMTAAFRTNLTALSLLALLVGLFLIYNTMTFSVVQRRPLFGLSLIHI